MERGYAVSRWIELIIKSFSLGYIAIVLDCTSLYLTEGNSFKLITGFSFFFFFSYVSLYFSVVHSPLEQSWGKCVENENVFSLQNSKCTKSVVKKVH